MESSEVENPKLGSRSFRSLLFLLVLWLLVCYSVAALGSWFTAEAVDTWYKTISKPSWNPPNWIFPVVWTSLFGMMAVSAARIHWLAGWNRSLVLFLIQLVANLTWSLLFFYLQQMALAAVEIVVLEILIVSTAVQFWKLDRVAGWLLVPYALWVGFACVLNAVIVGLNW